MTAFAYIKGPVDLLLTHEDAGEWFELQCVGALQPTRGRFASKAVLYKALGKGRARRCIRRGDVEALPDGRWEITDWDELQEGDRTVAERMRNWRKKRKAREDVTKLFALPAHRNGSDASHRNARYGHVTPGVVTK